MKREYRLKTPWILFLGLSIVLILLMVTTTTDENNSGVSEVDIGMSRTGENTQVLVEQSLRMASTLRLNVLSLSSHLSQLSDMQKLVLSSHLEATSIDIEDLITRLKDVKEPSDFLSRMQNNSEDLKDTAILGEE